MKIGHYKLTWERAKGGIGVYITYLLILMVAVSWILSYGIAVVYLVDSGRIIPEKTAGDSVVFWMFFPPGTLFLLCLLYLVCEIFIEEKTKEKKVLSLWKTRQD
jgi:hypothetical protein